MSLPTHTDNQAYCRVSALEGGLLGLPDRMIITDASPDAVTTAPSLSFLIQNSHDPLRRVLFDLGIRKDWENYTPQTLQRIQNLFAVKVEQDVVASLLKGGLTPSDIAFVCLSHLHWDHFGDPRAFTNATFLVGAASAELLKPEAGYPAEPTGSLPENLLPQDRTTFLGSTGSEWTPLGPFPRALDFWGDGSLYIVDAPGHCLGHLNILARTSSDGGWCFLAGDSAHHCKIISGEAGIHRGEDGRAPMHHDTEEAMAHIERIKTLKQQPRVRILLAHDEPWYKDSKGGTSFWPGSIPSL